MCLKTKPPVQHVPQGNKSKVNWVKVTKKPTTQEPSQKPLDNAFSSKFSVCLACLQRAPNSLDCRPLCKPWIQSTIAHTTATKTTTTTSTVVKPFEKEPVNWRSINDEPNIQQLQQQSQLTNVLIKYEDRLFWFIVFAMGSIITLLSLIISILLFKSRNKRKRVDIMRTA